MPLSTIKEHLFSTITEDEKIDLQECVDKINLAYKTSFNSIFSSISRRFPVSRDKIISIPNGTKELIIQEWSVQKLIRVYLISLVKDDEVSYCKFFDNLFQYGDLQELVALYSSLNILDYPEYWVERCKDGVRNNIGLVQEAVIEQNMFPFHYLDENAWNQMILKSFFTSKNVLKIYGLFDRNNKSLAESIVDYIYERHSAKRNIHPILWLLAKDYLPERALRILEESFARTSEKLEQSILFQVMTVNKTNLPADINLEFLRTKFNVISFSEEVLDLYKKGELCVQN